MTNECPGHLDDLTERKAWMKVKGWFDAYGAVYRVLGLLGVRFHNCL